MSHLKVECNSFNSLLCLCLSYIQSTTYTAFWFLSCFSKHFVEMSFMTVVWSHSAFSLPHTNSWSAAILISNSADTTFTISSDNVTLKVDDIPTDGKRSMYDGYKGKYVSHKWKLEAFSKPYLTQYLNMSNLMPYVCMQYCILVILSLYKVYREEILYLLERFKLPKMTLKW